MQHCPPAALHLQVCVTVHDGFGIILLMMVSDARVHESESVPLGQPVMPADSTAADGAAVQAPAWPPDWPLRWAQAGFEGLHRATGLPWWATIVVATGALRSITTLPLAVFVHRNAAKMQIDAAPFLEAWKERIAVDLRAQYRREGRSFQEFEAAFREQWAKRVRSVLKEQGVRGPAFSLAVPLVQMPMWIAVSLTIRRMSAAPLLWFEPLPEPVAGFTNGGIFSWTDLSQPVGSYAIPIAIGVTNLFNIQWGVWTRRAAAKSWHRYITHLMRVLSIAMIPAAASVPSALAIYWLSSSGFSVLQNAALFHPRVRSILKMRSLPSEQQTVAANVMRQWQQGTLAASALKAVREWRRPIWWRPIK